MPVLLERTPFDPLHMHAWWASVARRRPGEGEARRHVLDARFDSAVCSLPAAALPACLSSRAPLFLEDHCILARTARFPPASPLFDPAAAFRREFFDLAWGIRRRGGGVSLAVESVVIYDRLVYAPSLLHAPAGGTANGGTLLPVELPSGPSSFDPMDDLFGFVARRHDAISDGSVRSLNDKWRVHYRVDEWHEHQRDCTLDGLRLDRFTHPQLFESPAQRARLVLTFLLLAGYDRCQLSEDGAPAGLDIVEALRRLPQPLVPDGGGLFVRFWQRGESLADAASRGKEGEAVVVEAEAREAATREEEAGEEATEGRRHPLDGIVPLDETAVATGENAVVARRAVWLLRLCQLSPGAAIQCDECAAMATTTEAWFWVRDERDDPAERRGRAPELAQRLAHALGGRAAVERSIDLTSNICSWRYRPLSLSEFEAFCERALSVGDATGTDASAASGSGSGPLHRAASKRARAAMRSLHAAAAALARRRRSSAPPVRVSARP